MGPVGVLNDHDRIKQYAQNLAAEMCFVKPAVFQVFSQSHQASFRHKVRQPNALTLFDYVSLSSPFEIFIRLDE